MSEIILDMDDDLKRMLEGESGTFTIGPLAPQEFLQQIADSGLPGALFAKFCLENQNVQIAERMKLDTEE